ncbi:MAG: 2-oxoglutarate dehydrogenase E1 component [Alphaproteobacteria bacterium]|nr:2-oxoglutarate dehydrogenase E1 component [Alphaproteobacteria bacterium]
MASQIDQDSFLSGGNAAFVAELFGRFAENPDSVDESWRQFFSSLGDDEQAVLTEIRGATWSADLKELARDGSLTAETAPAAMTAPSAASAVPGDVRAATLDSIRALMLIRSHRVRGHLMANLDPLGIHEPEDHPELDPSSYGFTDGDWDREIFIDNVLGLETANLHEIVRRVRDTYCGTIGVEYMHIQEPDRKAWIQERIEAVHNRTQFTDRGKRAILERLVEAEEFENFLDKKYTGTKRFGLDGGESAIPALEQIVKRGGQLGLKEVVIGMPHRGRLNVLANFMAKPFQAIFSEFQGNTANPEDVQGSGDVKYHLGTSSDREFDDSVVHLSLTANPSHLEAVNTVAVGKVRAKQQQRGDTERGQVMCLLMHGDAAFAGQGLVAETLDLSELKGYRTGGTIHFIINNQIGFTTSPRFSRSSPYCSDVGKIVQAPIFHVNGDDPEAVVHVARIAMEYRQQFKSDVVVDMFCYRRFGHNEGDEPSFTQPLMYKKIADHPTARAIYAKRLVDGGVATQDEVDAYLGEFRDRLQSDFDAANSYKPNKADWLEGAWTGMETAAGEARRGVTAVPEGILKTIATALTTVPEGFNIHRKLVRQLKTKSKMMETGEGIDWATAEALAFGSLLVEGCPVRLSGQDSGRGTFSQRHAVWVDQETEARYIPLNHVKPAQPPFEVIDSPLSEVGVLGFEYGFTLAEPNALVLWEAQFGDFANGAQVILDQFVSSAESKWLRMSGLVMLLPHGFEGQGPEHSSARLERYLQLCAEDNMQVCNITEPFNYFHALRRQIHRKFRKPLILMTPKSLLRHKMAISNLSEFTEGTTFHRVLWDHGQQAGTLADDGDIRRVVMCTGKVYYDLYQERESRGLKDVYLLRLEQLYPFPREALTNELARFPQAEMVWCQEEPKNMGAWSSVEPSIELVLGEVGARHKRPSYAGRVAAASPASGSLKRHQAEQKKFVDDALTVS